MRGTLHLVAAEDLRWLVNLFGPVFATGNQARHAELGLTDELKTRGARAIRRILAEQGPLTRQEMVEQLGRFGIDLDRRSQAPIHLIAFAAFNGVCCLGPDRRKGEPTYVLLDDWAKPRPMPSRPLGELARRYFSAYGPASSEDFAAWSGLKAAQVRTAVQEAMNGLDQLSHGGMSLWLAKGRTWKRTDAPPQDVRLLPAFDTYLLGYRSRNLAVDQALQKRLQRGGGWLHPAIVVNGRAIGAWSLGRGQDLEAELEEREAAELRKRIGLEVEDIGRFLGRALRLRLG